MFYIIGLLVIIFNSSFVFGDNILATINSDDVLNVVSDKFISFTIDPHILLERNNTEYSDDCLCMANLLSPAYLRIAGPSTEHIAIEESLIKYNKSEIIISNNDEEIEVEEDVEYVETSVEKWKNFMNWIKLAGLTPIVALNNVDRFPCGNWNPKTTVQALSIVEQSNIGECIWQLGDECRNQTTQKYMNDLQILKVLIDAFQSGKNGKWKMVSADVSQCLGDDDAKNLLTFLLETNHFLNAAILNSNGTDDLLNILKKNDKEKVHRQLTKKNTELWKTIENNQIDDGDALLWLKSIGNAAKDGYSVVFKDLSKKDLEEWSMSYYVSLLHKKFVGPEVLNMSINTTNTNVSVYGHCSTLPSGPKTNGVTLFACNEDSNSAEKITFKISMEEEGEIMQFILKKNDNGTVFINGKETVNDGDIQPDVRKVKPFKAIKVTVPPKSIGFWILPSANVKACYGIKKNMIRANRNKNMGTGRIAETLYQILEESKDLLTSHRKKRSVEETDDMNDLKIQLLLEDMNNDYSSDIFDLKAFKLLEDIEKMLNLEDEFLKLGSDLLKSDYFDNESIYDYDENLSNHIRVIRDVHNAEDNIKEETQIEEVAKELKSSALKIVEETLDRTVAETKEEVKKPSLIKLPPLNLPKPSENVKTETFKLPTVDLSKKIKENKDSLIDKARSVVKNELPALKLPNSDMIPSENVKTETFKLPAVDLPKKIKENKDSLIDKARSAVKNAESIKLPKIDLKETDDRIKKLVDKARSIVKNVDMTPSENTKVESVLELPKLRSARVKEELLKHDNKFNELKDKMKARLAELKTKTTHKINKRNVAEDIKESHHVKHIDNAIKKQSMEVDSNENMIETLSDDDKIVYNDIKRIEEVENDSKEYIDYEDKSHEKHEDSNKIIRTDSSESLETIEDHEDDDDFFNGMIKSIQGFFNDLKDTISDWWSGLSGGN